MSSSTNKDKVFLSAEWCDLIFLNYVVEPALLLPHIPAGTTLSAFNGKIYVSLVGFRFCKTKLCGKLAIPFHGEFEEANLRFYVHREIDGGIRRGVVFIKEIVPKPAIALTARWVYGENYISLPMRHEVVRRDVAVAAEYSWSQGDSKFRILASSQNAPVLPSQGSLEQYITEHYWGYSRQKAGRTFEYRVDHVPWPVGVAERAGFEGPVKRLYGSEFAPILARAPDSAYIADGSFVEVFEGSPL